jgi:hypothetical protein
MDSIQPKNTYDVLSELLEPLRNAVNAVDMYFDQADDQEILNPFQNAGNKEMSVKNEKLPVEFFQGFGLQRLILNTTHGRLSLSDKDFIDSVERDAPSFRWQGQGADLIMDDLKTLFENSRVVEFKNWSDVKNASAIWDNLRRDVIRTLTNRDFDFIFYPGDLTSKLKFEVDEFLDIISDFSVCGRVTLVLDEQDVDGILEIFFGREADARMFIVPGLREKCRSVFDLLNIEYLVAGSYKDAHFFSKQQQFEIEGRKGIDIPKIETRHFIYGYMLGLLLRFGISHSITLGLGTAGLYSGIGSKPDCKSLIGFIEKWMGELEPHKTTESSLEMA